jgi:hypothetical protein
MTSPLRQVRLRLQHLHYRLPFMEHQGSLLCSQNPATGAYPEPEESSPHIQTQFLSDHFNTNIRQKLNIFLKSKAIPVTGRGGPQGCETLRLPHFLDNRLTDGGEVVSLKRRPPLNPPEDYWYSFAL